MKKLFTNLKVFMTLCLLLVSFGNAWGEDKYVKITSTADLEVGAEYAIVTGSTYALTTEMNSTNGLKFAAATVNTDGTISLPAKGASLTLGGSLGSYTLSDTNGYFSANGTSNKSQYLGNVSANGESTFAITFNATSGSVTITTTQSTARTCKANGTTDARFYSTSSGNVLYLYKKQGAAKTLESIAISGTPTKKTYEAGETFDPAGLKVMGTYEGQTDPEEITSGITWNSTPNPLTAGTTSVSVTATVGEITSDAYQVNGLTVLAALPKITITADKIAEFVDTYAEYTWTASNVTGKCWAYRGGSSGSYNIQFNKTTYVYNTTAVPGRITSVKMTKVSGTTRSWSIYGADEALTGDNYTTAGTQIGSAQEVSDETGTTWNVPNDKNYTYFYITKADGGTNIGEIVITYEEDKTPSITADVEEIKFEQKELSGTATDSKVISATGKNLTAAISASMKSGSDAVFSVVANGTPTAAAGEFTVSYSTTEAGEYAGTVVLSSGETTLEIPVSASVVAHIPVLQSVAVKTAPTKTTYFVGEKFDPTGLEITATYDTGDPKDISYFGNEDKFSFNPALDAALATTDEKVTFTYGNKTAEQAITVKTIANTPGNAYTVAEAKALIDANPAELATTEVYVKGTVSNIVTEWSSQYGNITFDVSEDGQTTGDQFRFYRNFQGANKTKWASAAECPAVGDDVIGLGKLTKYSSTYEFTEGNYIVSLIRVATLSIDDITVSLGGTITPEITSNVPEDERTITYSVASEDVVKVQDGKLVTVAVGGPVEVTATLTADSYKETTTTFEVTVIKALQSITVKTEPTTTSYKVGDKFDPTGLVIIANYTTGDPDEIAYAENEDKFTFEPSLETALSIENTSVTITYAGKETTQTITVRDLYTFDITWMANGKEFAKTQVTEGDALALPGTSPANIGDMKFMGWIAAESYYDASEAPEYIVPADIKPTEDMKFYAVYAKHTSELQEKDVTYTFTSKSWGDATSSWTSGKDGNSYQNNQGVQVTNGVTGANATSKSEFTEVTKVVVNYCTNEKAGKGTIKVKVGDGTAQSYSVSAPSSGGTTLRNTDDMIFENETGNVNITVGCETNSIYINSITITSKVGEETISNYCTRFANVEISSAGWATVCLPFKATITSDNATAYYVTGTNEDALDKTPVKVIKAGEGVLLKSDNGGEATVTFTESAEQADDASFNMMIGSLTGETFEEDGFKYYILANDETNGLGFYYQGASGDGTSAKCAAGKAVLAVPASAGIKSFFSLDDETTSIHNSQFTIHNSENDVMYNLNGQVVGKDYKGIVIVNGKKMLNK